MDDACWDDGRVVPVTCAAVILAGVVTLSGFTWHTPCQKNFSVKSWADKTFTQIWLHWLQVLHGLSSYRNKTHPHSVKLACDTLHSGSPGGPVLSQGRCWARTPTGGSPLTWRMAWWSGSCTYYGNGSSNLKWDKDHHSWIQFSGSECDDGNLKLRRMLRKILGQIIRISRIIAQINAHLPSLMKWVTNIKPAWDEFIFIQLYRFVCLDMSICRITVTGGKLCCHCLHFSLPVMFDGCFIINTLNIVALKLEWYELWKNPAVRWQRMTSETVSVYVQRSERGGSVSSREHLADPVKCCLVRGWWCGVRWVSPVQVYHVWISPQMIVLHLSQVCFTLLLFSLEKRCSSTILKFGSSSSGSFKEIKYKTKKLIKINWVVDFFDSKIR